MTNPVSRVILGGFAIGLALCASGCADESGSREGEAVEVAPIGPEPAGAPAQYPFVLEHGFAASPELNGFDGVAGALEADGHKVYVSSVPPFQTARIRAEHLAETVDRALADGATKVNIIAHSMGGLDARVLISQLGYGDRVATLTTVSTPHGGSRMADMLLGLAGAPTANDNRAIQDFLRWFGMQFSDVAGDPDLRGALVDLSEENAPAFNEANPNDPRVLYQSVAGVSSALGITNPEDFDACDRAYYERADGSKAYPGPGGRADWMTGILLKIAGTVAHGFELRPNDGLVTIDSARLEGSAWLGCVPADHADEIGQFDPEGPDPVTGFDHIRYYRNLAFSMSAEGY
jgi:triacylglycerol lipase